MMVRVENKKEKGGEETDYVNFSVVLVNIKNSDGGWLSGALAVLLAEERLQKLWKKGNKNFMETFKWALILFYIFFSRQVFTWLLWTYEKHLKNQKTYFIFK